MSDMHSSVTVYGAAYSVYVQIVRIALHEKGVPYRLVPVDIFADEGVPAEHLARHPFGRIPAFEHEGFGIYETSAIIRYVDEAFSGPPLQPRDLHDRARMNQIVAMLDNYAYLPMVWDVYVERIERSKEGVTNEARIAAGLAKTGLFFKALSDLLGERLWLAGAEPSLADFHAAPMFGLFVKTPEGAALLKDFPAIATWWERTRIRPSVLAACE